MMTSMIRFAILSILKYLYLAFLHIDGTRKDKAYIRLNVSVNENMHGGDKGRYLKSYWKRTPVGPAEQNYRASQRKEEYTWESYFHDMRTKVQI